MPTFRTAPSSNLTASIKRLLASGGGNLNPLQEIRADSMAAQTAQHLGLAEKARAEVEAMRRAEADRANPALATEYAGNVAGMDVPSATRLSNHLRGVLEQPSVADQDDAAMIGAEAQPYVTGAPNVAEPQKRLFQSALASTFANRLATGKTSADQLAQAGDRINETALTNQAANTANVPEANRIVAAVAGKLREPFKTNPQGTVLNEETGVLNEGSQLAAAARAHLRKDAGGKPPAGYRWTADGLEAIPGGPADQKLQGQLNQDTATLNNSINSMDRLATAANEALQSPGLGGITGIRGVIPNIPGSEAANAQAKLNTLKSQVAFGVLQEMRNNSKTGGALGQVSDAEGKRLEANLAALENAQSVEQMKNSLAKIIDYANGAKDRIGQAYNLKHGDKTRQSPALQPAAKPAALPVVNAKGWKLMKDAKGNQAYVSSDGMQFEEVR